MSQEYELLSAEVKAQFEQHVATHEQYKQQAMMMQFLNTIPSDGSVQGDPNADPTAMDVTTGDPTMGAGAQMSANGAVPDMTA